MDFSDALHAVKSGEKISRHGWNANYQFVVYQKGYPDGIEIDENTAEATGFPLGTKCLFQPYLMLLSAKGSFVPWVPSMGDLMAEDWRTI